MRLKEFSFVQSFLFVSILGLLFFLFPRFTIYGFLLGWFVMTALRLLTTKISKPLPPYAKQRLGMYGVSALGVVLFFVLIDLIALEDHFMPLMLLSYGLGSLVTLVNAKTIHYSTLESIALSHMMFVLVGFVGYYVFWSTTAWKIATIIFTGTLLAASACVLFQRNEKETRLTDTKSLTIIALTSALLVYWFVLFFKTTFHSFYGFCIGTAVALIATFVSLRVTHKAVRFALHGIVFIGGPLLVYSIFTAFPYVTGVLRESYGILLSSAGLAAALFAFQRTDISYKTSSLRVFLFMMPIVILMWLENSYRMGVLLAERVQLLEYSMITLSILLWATIGTTLLISQSSKR